VHYLNNVSIGIGSVLTPAGLDKSAPDHHGLPQGADDKQFESGPAIVKWREFMKNTTPTAA